MDSRVDLVGVRTVTVSRKNNDAGNIALDYGIYGVPESFFIDPDGMIFYKQIGGVTPELLANKFEPFL